MKIETGPSSLLCAIILCNHLPFFKVFSNFVHFCPNYQIFCPFLPFFAFFLKNCTYALTFQNRPCDTNLSWQFHVNDLTIKRNRASGLLFKMRKYVSHKILRSIYFAMLAPTYPIAALPGLRILALFNEL